MTHKGLTSIAFGDIFTSENMILGKGKGYRRQPPHMLALSPNQSLCQCETVANVEMLANGGSLCGRRRQGKSKCKSFFANVMSLCLGGRVTQAQTLDSTK